MLFQLDDDLSRDTKCRGRLYDLNKESNEIEQSDDADATNETQSQTVSDESQLSLAPNDTEIKEIQDDELPEQTCIECNTVRLCKYTLLKDDVQKYLCEIDCVKAYQSASDKQYKLIIRKITISLIPDAQQQCIRCNKDKLCKYRMKNIKNDSLEYLCGDGKCLEEFIGRNKEKYIVTRKRYLIEEIKETTDSHNCIQCSESKECSFMFKLDDGLIHICNEACLNLLMIEQSDRFRVKRRTVRVRDLQRRGGGSATTVTDLTENENADQANKVVARTEEEAEAARIDRENSFIRRCAHCFKIIPTEQIRSLQWETMDYCNEICLGQYQGVVGASCAMCNSLVNLTSLGKYCVRFGYEIRQFCKASCLDIYKKGLKVCSYCQKDISKEADGFLASVCGQFKDFCSQMCMKRYDDLCNPKKKMVAGICSVCNNVDQIRVEIIVDGREHEFCSNPCFSAFKFVNNIFSDKCAMCPKYFERKSCDAHTIFNLDQSEPTLFCSKICINIYIITNRKIVPCQWCKVKKYNFDMILKQSNNKQVSLCSLNCLTFCEVSMNAIAMKKQKCDQCGSISTPQYHLTMSDASLRNFCTYQCVMSFQSQFSNAPLSFDGGDISNSLPAITSGTASPVPTGLPKRIKGVAAVNPAAASKPTKTKQTSVSKVATLKAQQSNKSKTNNNSDQIPIIANVTSLANPAAGRRNRTVNFSNSQISMSLQPVVELEPISTRLLKKSVVEIEPLSARSLKKSYGTTASSRPAPVYSPPPRQPTPPPIIRVEHDTKIVTLPPKPKLSTNEGTMCKPAMVSKEMLCKPASLTFSCQTDSKLERVHIIPIPVPIFIPQPLHMYSLPLPLPVPFPLPIPVPIFIPTTRNAANGIMKEIKKVQDKMPTDPFEAELLMMAEMVAGDKKKSESDEEDEANDHDVYGTDTITENNSFGEDMLQMALKMAGEYENEPSGVDLESAMQANTITPGEIDENNPMHHHLLLLEHQRQLQQRGRKRMQPAAPRPRINAPITPPNKRQRRQEIQEMPPQQEQPREPVEKADANMCLKFTFGVNAWKQWVMTKNADLEKSSIRRKPFKSELLQLTADELNYSLCLFVKEVRKPNGSEYAPDTIYYLVLGIQQYLYENGRIDNIFTDPYYEKFTDCLDDVAKKFSVLYNDSQYIVTRVEEEHLWECKQLGAHSPHVLLSTLMFFNTKHFNLTTVEEHMQLSFSHIMKHWKRNPNQVSAAAKTPGSRNVLLRFYPPQSALDSNSRKKKVYEQQENEENPLRCPVKLYEFYLSKCPESVKTRNDVFYLQPERSCVPDSPVWYSTQALGKDSLCKMLHRVKMVKEINIALLTS